jgi:hypothetical protein
LLTSDEVRMLDNRYALLFMRGERPIRRTISTTCSSIRISRTRRTAAAGPIDTMGLNRCLKMSHSMQTVRGLHCASTATNLRGCCWTLNPIPRMNPLRKRSVPK